MLKLVKECMPWLNGKTAGIAALVILGLILCTERPTLSILAGVTPLLLLAACLIPCLIPLLFLRNKKSDQGVMQLSAQGTVGKTCGCGQDACSFGPGSITHWREHATMEATGS